MLDQKPPSLSPLALAARWVTRITSIGLGMMVPGLIGLGIDYWLKTKVLFLILGLCFGVPYGMWRLIQLTQSELNQTKPRGGLDAPGEQKGPPDKT